jgi:hypothetical protein
MYKRIFLVALIFIFFISLSGQALAQTYSFSLDEQSVDIYWNEDGTMSLDYVLVFTNDTFASPIDYVDLGLPTKDFSENSITAEVNGRSVSDISASGYMGDGVGVAIGLGQNAIQPGSTGVVWVHVEDVRNVLREDSQDNEYSSAVFSPTWFGSKYVHGDTALTVTFHLPPGVQPDEPKWHSAPNGFPQEPITALDDQGRVTYSWSNPSANGYTQYLFGASFPKEYVPESAIGSTSFLEMLGISINDLITWTCFCGIGLIIIMVIALSIRSSRRRKLQYLPPKVSIEGHGIKRGLTAVEAAILMEQPMDKILTMILFSVIKKDAARVVTRDPLDIEVAEPIPSGIHPYEVQFLKAFTLKKKKARRAALQDMMTKLVKIVAKKMKGFSRKETVAYYRKIMERAWQQVEAADTPEVKSEKFNDVMEWTMLDRDYDDRTRRTFGSGPVFVPIWWHRYDPTFRPSAPSRTTSMPTSRGTGPSVSMPNLPGGEFAASMVTGVQTMSTNVIGNLTDFTSNITNKTNPVPVSKSSGGWSSGSGGCACACACAGCACACAGGGR